jgi:hypothetical protein
MTTFQVLNSVQMTGSSLQRFKRKGLSAGENNAVNGTAGETDESKIRRQLQLDTQRMRTHAESANANVQKLDDFLKLLEQESA